MNAEVIDLGHEVIDATIIVVPNLREKVVDGFLQGMFEVRSKACFTVFLEFFEAFVVGLLFVPVVLGEELVESAFAIGWKDFARDTRHGLVAGRNKTCGVGFRVMTLCWRQRVELVEHTHAGQEVRNRHHPSLPPYVMLLLQRTKLSKDE
ncbi:hypothetical protein C445_15366 [Halobiforma lacisalsi AJ5]|uniref:Uncharacterized protein n=1 Tax=Natronobacterium lacisalsi AJ5 TaxID=358396 RepID=M0LG21_NATLA|nr:hypothetical protein C445_15366 [Halobiforma lacisalsi AJ5]